jgi:hypothetical protein
MIIPHGPLVGCSIETLNMMLNSAAIERDFSLPLGNIGSVQPAILPSYLAIF